MQGYLNSKVLIFKIYFLYYWLIYLFVVYKIYDLIFFSNFSRWSVERLDIVWRLLSDLWWRPPIQNQTMRQSTATEQRETVSGKR